MDETFEFTSVPKSLTDEEVKKLESQNVRLVSEFKANELETNAKKHWDLFYKRNENRFFKDRNWTTREFTELLNDSDKKTRTIFEVGCGVGNLIYPLLREGLNFKFIACDISARAVELVKSHELFDKELVNVFQADISKGLGDVGSVDIVTLIFVLSAIHPDKFNTVLKNIHDVLSPGGVLLFRDYGLHDMAQIRFKAGHKIGENFYMRQDGTRSYYFSTEFVEKLAIRNGFEVISNTYVHRRTINKKENLDVPRIFIQGKFRKPVG